MKRGNRSEAGRKGKTIRSQENVRRESCVFPQPVKPKAGKRYSKADTGGLLLDITPGGVRSWQFRYRLNGKREKVVIGRYPDVSLKVARAERDKLAATVRAAKSPFQEQRLARFAVSTDPSGREFGDRYYKEQVEKKLKDPKQIRRYLDSEIYPWWGDRKLKEITPLDVQVLVYRKRDIGRPAAAMRLRMVLSTTVVDGTLNALW